MKISKGLAIFGFNLCASVFLGFCVYGLLVYTDGGSRRHFSTLLWGLLALGIAGCIAGIGYFGNQWDLRNVEESRQQGREGGSNPAKRKSKDPVTGR